MNRRDQQWEYEDKIYRLARSGDNDLFRLITDDNIIYIYDIVVRNITNSNHFIKSEIESSIIENPIIFNRIDKNYFIYAYTIEKITDNYTLEKATKVVIKCIKSVDKLNEQSIKIIIQIINERIKIGLNNNELIDVTLTKADKNYFIHTYLDDKVIQADILIKNTNVLISCIKGMGKLNQESIKTIIEIMNKRIDMDLNNNELLDVTLTKVDFHILRDAAVEYVNRKNVLDHLDEMTNKY